MSDILNKLETKNRGMIIIEGFKMPEKRTNKIDEKFQKIKQRIDEEKWRLNKSKENTSKERTNSARNKAEVYSTSENFRAACMSFHE